MKEISKQALFTRHVQKHYEQNNNFRCPHCLETMETISENFLCEYVEERDSVIFKTLGSKHIEIDLDDLCIRSDKNGFWVHAYEERYPGKNPEPISFVVFEKITTIMKGGPE